MGNKVFYQLPNHIVWSYTDTKSIYQLLNNDKLVHLFVAMNDLINPRGVCSFTVGGLLDTCNLPDNKENVKIFKDMLIELYKLQLFTIVNGIDIKTIRKSTWLSISPNWFVIKNDKRSEFFTLYRHELDRIMSYNSQGVNNYKLLIYYCYLVSRMYNRRNYTNAEGTEIKATIDMDRAETCHPSFEEISSDLSIDDNTITKYNDILVDLDLLRFRNAGFKKKIEYGKEVVRRSSHTYVLFRHPNWEQELEYSINGYIAIEKEKGWTFITNKEAEKSIKDRQVLSNTINRLEHLKETKGITEEQEQKLQDCIDKRNNIGKPSKQVNLETGEIVEEPTQIIVGRGSKSFTDDKEVMAGFSLSEDNNNPLSWLERVKQQRVNPTADDILGYDYVSLEGRKLRDYLIIIRDTKGANADINTVRAKAQKLKQIYIEETSKLDSMIG